MNEYQLVIPAERALINRETFLSRALFPRSGLLYILLLRSWRVLLPIAVMVILGVSLLENTLSVPIFFFLFLSIGLLIIFFIARGTNRQVALRLFASIYAYNVLVVVLFFYVFQAQYGNNYLIGGTDDMHFEYCGRYAAESLKVSGEIVIPPIITERNLSPFRYERYKPYITLLASVYYLSDMLANDMHTLNVRILNSLAIGLISFFAFLLAMRCGLSKSSFVGAFAVGTYPSLAFWGAVIVRDVWIVLFCVATVYCFERLITSDKIVQLKWLVMVIVMIFLIFLFRVQSAILMIGSLGLFSGFYTLKGKGLVIKTGFLVLYILLLLLLSLVLAGYYGDVLLFITIQTEYRMLFAHGLSKYIFDLPFVPFGMIIRPFYALISPFPSFFTLEVAALFKSVGTIGVILMLPFVFVGFLRSVADKKRLILGIVPVGFLVVISWTTFHPRYLLVYMPYLLLLGVYGWSTLKRPKLVLYISVSINTGLFLLYMGLKLIMG